MPGVRPRNRSNGSQQVNGLYVHSSPPKVMQINPKAIRQAIRSGDVTQLEQIVLEGQGNKLLGEYSPDPKVRNFLRQIPAYLSKISELHKAVSKGDLKQLQKLIEPKNGETGLKNIVKSKNHAGVGLLHKAVYHGAFEVVQFLIEKFPQIINMRDKEGKTALHYCGASKKAGKIWPLLIKAGADQTIVDNKGRLGLYYMEKSKEIQMADDKPSPEISNNTTTEECEFPSVLHQIYSPVKKSGWLAPSKFEPVLTDVSRTGQATKLFQLLIIDLIIKPSNLRIWIHDRDLGKLRQVIWEGHGGKLRVETSNNPRVRRFLEGVPHILNVIKDVHFAVVHEDIDDFVKKSSDPVPIEVLGSKDLNGLNPLHKAAGLGRTEIAENIIDRNKNLLYSVDNEGKTPLHWAAGLKDEGAMYNLLVGNGADEMAFDKNGKTPSYYRTNPKEINTKLLEVIPEAPRTAQAFPQTWDWMLFYPGGSAPSTIGSLPRESSPRKEINGEEKRQSIEEIPPLESFEPISKPKEKIELAEEAKPTEDPPKSLTPEAVFSEDKPETEPSPEPKFESSPEHNYEPSSEPNYKPTPESKQELSPEPKIIPESAVNSEESQTNNYDIWTNEESQSQDDKDVEDEGYPREEDIGGTNQTESDSDDKKYEDDNHLNLNKSEESLNDSGVNEGPETREKTEREIAEERQRMLDEGLIRINTCEEEPNDEDKINEIIESGDMEVLASMVLNGEGDKLAGKTSKNPEIQTFLDNLPAYMTKITAVHNAAKSGSLKDLQNALDRRRFAIAKESSDKLGATPLHVALLFGNSQIVKYLGGRFPETLTTKDKLGRTPLHYAAVLEDNNYFYNTLINLGANQKAEDNSGFTAEYYQENPGILTKEKLLEEFNEKGVSSPVTDPSVHNIEPEISFDEGIPLSKNKGNEEAEDSNNGNESPQSAFSTTDRDEYGQSILHFAAARAHGRGGLFQLIHESSVNLGYRDELYRTARDIALQANIPENINEIDRYVISLAARDESEKLIQLFLEGYDHILDLEDDEDNNIITVANNKNHEKTLAFLKAVPTFEDKRDRVHRAIRDGDEKLVQQIIGESKNGRLIVIGKNTTGRCSLHVAVLCQQKEITEYIAQKYPETLKIGDNLERTALHYAMGVDEVEKLSKILIKCGAKRVVKDLKGRQPTYYFMNKMEILKLQEEEDLLKA